MELARARRARLPRAGAALDDPRRGGVPLQARADPRRRLCGAAEVVARAPAPADGADWLQARSLADELVEIRAYHLDHAAELEEELEGAVAGRARRRGGRGARAGRPAGARARGECAPRAACSSAPPSSSDDARAALPGRARRLAADRHSRRSRRRWREVSDAAHEAGDARIEGRALIALAEVALYRDADTDCARELAGRALDVVDEPTTRARFDALEVLGNACWWEGDLDEVERLSQERLAIAERDRAAATSRRRA